MSLTAFTGATSAATLNDNFDDATATMTANAILGPKDQLIHMYKASLASGDAVSSRTMAWTQTDDMEVRGVYGHGTADAINRILTVTLAVDYGQYTAAGVALSAADLALAATRSIKFLTGNTVSISVTSGGAGAYYTRSSSTPSTANAHGDFTAIVDTSTDKSDRFRLLRGVRYRLTMSTNAGTWADAECGVILRTVRRRA